MEFPTFMPMDRLARTRRSLPEGYQFGDGRLNGIVSVADARARFDMPPLHDVPVDVLDMIAEATRDFMQACGVPSPLMHPADTADPDGYGHAV